MPDGVSTGRYTSSSLPCGRSYWFSGFERSLTSASIFPDRQRRLLVGAEGVARAHEARLVGVDDRAVFVPELHPYQRTIEHIAPNDGVDRAERGGRSVQHAVGQRGCDEALRLGDGGGACVRDRLALADPATRDRGGKPDDDERDRPASAKRPTSNATKRRPAHDLLTARRPGPSRGTPPPRHSPIVTVRLPLAAAKGRPRWAERSQASIRVDPRKRSVIMRST